MEIGEEQEAPVEYPIPVDPAKRAIPRREEVPVTAPAEPAKEPAHARSDAELDQALVDAVQSVGRQLAAMAVSMTERGGYARCGRG